jgi:hypothetical protein
MSLIVLTVHLQYLLTATAPQRLATPTLLLHAPLLAQQIKCHALCWALSPLLTGPRSREAGRELPVGNT